MSQKCVQETKIISGVELTPKRRQAFNLTKNDPFIGVYVCNQALMI